MIFKMADNKIHRVIFFEPYPMGLGGNFSTQKLILERLDLDTFEPIVMAPIEGVALQEFRAIGIKCIVVPPPKSIASYGGLALKTSLVGRIRAAIDLFRYNLTLARYFRKNDISLVYANGVRAQLFVGFGAILARVPTLIYIKGALENPFVDRLCLFLATKILFQCSLNRDDKYPLLIRALKSKIDILPPGMDMGEVDEVKISDHSTIRRELGIDSKYVNAIIVAQIYPPKGQHLAIEALHSLAQAFPEARLYIAGDHVLEEFLDYRKRLEELVGKYGLADHIKFIGWRKDILSVVSEMDIVIHPSFAEGFARAVLEAMALGKPVIASAVGGLRVAIQNGENGFLVPPGDAASISHYWKQLLRSAEVRRVIGLNARKSVIDRYNMDDKVKSLSEIWLAMLRAKA